MDNEPYATLTRLYLAANKPHELKRLEQEGLLTEFLAGMQEDYNDLEERIYWENTRNPPERTMARAQYLQSAANVARECAREQMFEFLGTIE